MIVQLGKQENARLAVESQKRLLCVFVVCFSQTNLQYMFGWPHWSLANTGVSVGRVGYRHVDGCIHRCYVTYDTQVTHLWELVYLSYIGLCNSSWIYFAQYSISSFVCWVCSVFFDTHTLQLSSRALNSTIRMCQQLRKRSTHDLFPSYKPWYVGFILWWSQQDLPAWSGDWETMWLKWIVYSSAAGWLVPGHCSWLQNCRDKAPNV